MDSARDYGAVCQCADHPKKLITAAADYAEEGGQPPYELLIAWQVERWGASAVFGAEAVPLNLLLRMSAALNVYNAHRSFLLGSGNVAQWAEANPSQFEIVASVRRMRQNA